MISTNNPLKLLETQSVYIDNIHAMYDTIVFVFTLFTDVFWEAGLLLN